MHQAEAGRHGGWKWANELVKPDVFAPYTPHQADRTLSFLFLTIIEEKNIPKFQNKSRGTKKKKHVARNNVYCPRALCGLAEELRERQSAYGAGCGSKSANQYSGVARRRVSDFLLLLSFRGCTVRRSRCPELSLQKLM
jgi:hypothetical protein